MYFDEPTEKELDEIHRYYNHFCAIDAPNDLFEYMRSTYKGRHYKAAALVLPTSHSSYTNTEAHRRATLCQWSYIIDRLEPVSPKHFPRGEHVRSFTQKYEVLGNEIELEFVKEESDDCWHFAQSTLEQTRKLYRLVLGTPPVHHRFLSRFFPAAFFHICWGLSYFQWTLLAIGLLFGFPLYFAVKHILLLIATLLSQLSRKKELSPTSRSLVGPLSSIVVVHFWYMLLHQIILNPEINEISYFVCSIFTTVICIALGIRIVNLVAEKFKDKYRKDLDYGIHHSEIVIPLISRIAKILLVCIGTVVLADSLGLPVFTILGGMGIGGVAVAFAAKETIADFFGSVTVLVDRPFVVGDWIETGDVSGTVMSIGFRSTKIRTYANSIVTIPNNTLTTAVIDNSGKGYRFRTFISMCYSTSGEKIDAFCDEIRELLKNHPKTNKEDYLVELNEMHSSSLDVLIDVGFNCTDFLDEAKARAQFLRDILRLTEKLEIDFAYPTQMLHFLRQPQPGVKSDALLFPEPRK